MIPAIYMYEMNVSINGFISTLRSGFFLVKLF